MECRAFLKWFGGPLVLTTMTYSWMGCSQADLSGYHQVPQQKSNPDAESSNDEKLTSDQSNSPSADVAARPNEQLKDGQVANADIPISALVPVNKVDGSSIQSVINLPATASKSADDTKTPPTGSKPAVTEPPAEPRKIELLVKDKAFSTEPKTGSLRVSFDDLDLLKVLNMEPVTPDADQLMPGWLQGLNGKKVRIRGYMYPTYDTEGIERFVLARDNQICCFGRDPKIYDLIQIDMKAGTSTNYIPATRAFDVVGNFHIQMQSEDGKPFGLYVIDQATVIDR